MTSARPGAQRRRRIDIGGRLRGSPISPRLANLYFRRFLLAWERFDHRKRLDAYVVNYADDLVICCRPGNGSEALTAMRQLMTRLGLTVNEAKTRLVRLPGENFDFLGYSIGRFHGKDGVPYIGTRPFSTRLAFHLSAAAGAARQLAGRDRAARLDQSDFANVDRRQRA